MSKIVIAYVPVLHDGYRQFFQRHTDAEAVYVLGDEVIQRFDYLARKDIRRVTPSSIVEALNALGWSAPAYLLDETTLAELRAGEETLVFPNEDISKQLVADEFEKREVVYTDIFLRWDKHNTATESPADNDRKISTDQFDREMMRTAYEKAQDASDWFRRIGALVVKDGEIIMSARNRHLPSDHAPYTDGDPRAAWHKGVHLELSTVLHAEAGLVAEAARRGVSLEGASMYVTTFPCPPCAKQIAYAGISHLYYAEGYAVLDGERVLKDNGVEIIKVAEER